MNRHSDLADEFARLWSGESAPDLDAYLTSAGAVDTAQLSRLARIDQAERWQRGDRRLAETYLNRYPALQADHDSAVDLIYHEFLMREKLAEHPSVGKFTNRFPAYAAAIADQVSFHHILTEYADLQNASVPHLESPLLPKLPAQFGRYRVLELLGRGGMGTVYLAEDPELGRQVALKLPRLDRDRSPDTCDRFRREARIAATLHHPNLCPVFDFGELEGSLYLTMPYMVGLPLSTRLRAGPLPEKEAVQIALKVAVAMSVAHRSGVVHRDLKPSNILLCDDGEPVVMDFGLARRGLDLDPKLTGSGAMMGTLAYLAPEQIRSTDHKFDVVSDVYSLGVILYEMVVGRTPFEGTWQEVLEQIQFELPSIPSGHVPGLSSVVDQICLRALEKNPKDRLESMDALADALLLVGDSSNKGSSAAAKLRAASRREKTTSEPARSRATVHRRPRLAAIVTLLAVLAMIIVGWFAWQSTGIAWAREQIPVIEELAGAERFVEAYDLAVRVHKYLPNDVRMTRLMSVVSDTLSVTTQPEGARVYLKRFNGRQNASAAERMLVGTTPLLDLEFARSGYVLSIEKDGYVPFQRTLSGATVQGLEGLFPSTQIDLALRPVAEAPPEMVFVPGSEYRLVAWMRPTDAKVKLDSYFIDEFEVSNRQYKEFVEAGGYSDKRFWTQPFVKDGQQLSHDEAMGELTDRTGQSGPRDWSNQSFPEGRADHPVTGITWYEAMAYAAFRGKNLPTVFQWEKAARNGANSPLGLTMPWGLLQGSTKSRANFASGGTVPVGSHEFGMSPFGCFEMAGNVSEWCLNESSQGFITAGSSWGSNAYEFGYYGMYPAFDHSDQRGFRCVLNSLNPAGDQGAMSINLANDVPQYTPRPDAEVRAWFARYQYDKNSPLQASVLQVKDTNEWRREKIEYNSADGERGLAYLYLPPKKFSGPHQVIHFVPAGDVWYGFRSVPESIEADYGGFVSSGRAILAVVPRGAIERKRPNWVAPAPNSAEFVDDAARGIIDLRRGLDYLKTRDDMDVSRIAFMHASAGGYLIAQPAIEDRYRAVILWGGGIKPHSETLVHPEASPVNFAPLIRVPKLLVHGRHDEATPLMTEAEPLFKLLPEPKRVLLYDGGHRPNPEFLVREVNKFLDETLGAVMPNPKIAKKILTDHRD